MQNLTITGLIGFRAVSATSGSTGLDVADAPGVGASLAVAIKDADTATALLLWEKVERRAGHLLLTGLLGGLHTQPCGSAVPAPSPSTVGWLDAPAAGTYAGVTLDWSPEPGPLVASLFTLQVKAESADADARLIVVDLLDGEKLHDVAAPLAEGNNELRVDWVVKARYTGLQRTFVGLSTTSRLRATSPNGAVRATGLDATLQGATYGGGAAGVLSATVGCDLAAYVKQHADRFALPLWYLCAAELLNEKLASPRTNWLTLHDPEAAQATRDALRKGYEVALAGLLDHLPGGGPCASRTRQTLRTASLVP